MGKIVLFDPVDKFISDGAELAKKVKMHKDEPMKVLIIYTGGIPTRKSLSDQQVEQQLKSYLELQLVAQVDITVLTQLAGADVTFGLSPKIGTHIMEHYADYEGFVIIHSIDNAIYTANLLAFQLINLGKPVIFTGTTIPEQFFNFPGNFTADEQISYREMSLRTSLVTSVQLATLNCAGVMLAYGPHIIQAVRAVENCTAEQTGFLAWPDGEIATVRFGIEVTPRTPKRHGDPPVFDERFSTDVVVLPRQPELTLTNVLPTTRALLLPTFQEQLAPTHLTWPNNLPVIVVGSVYTQVNIPPNILRLPPITPVAAHMKLLAAAGRHQSASALKEYMQTNVIGEFGRL